jgi:hypothetical protein
MKGAGKNAKGLGKETRTGGLPENSIERVVGVRWSSDMEGDQGTERAAVGQDLQKFVHKLKWIRYDT